MYKTVSVCRACGLGSGGPPTLKESAAAGPPQSSAKLQKVFSLGLQPLANDFCTGQEEQAGFAPLEVMLCPNCSNAQLSVVVNPQILYSKYRYVTSTSQTMREHFDRILSMLPLASRSMKFLEIGSNDGLFLKFLKDHGHQIYGVDPAANLCEKARKAGLDVCCDFWGEQVGREVACWRPDFIIARHVFCHVENWAGFIKGLEAVAEPETLICIEVPYVQDLLKKGEFDTIYHEHTSYFSVKAMAHLLAASSLRLHRIDSLTIHGGALMVQLRHRDSVCPPDKSVSATLNSEECGAEAWREFDFKCHAKIGALQSFVDQARTNGKTVVGYGASAKSTVWINACRFTRKQISFITDTTAEKLYRFSPGTDIPIVDEGALTRDLPDYAICFAWNYLPEILEKEKIFLSKGGKFIVPHPDIKVVP